MPVPPAKRKKLVRPTYAVTIFMLIVGQLQVAVIMEIMVVKNFLANRYLLTLAMFFVSFLSIQLYGFFYHLIVTQSIWVRILAGMWTYQVNTLSIMKPAKHAPYFTLGISFLFTYLMMLLSSIYGKAARSHNRGLFLSRQKVILWSERLFVVTCFGIIVSGNMRDLTIELVTLIIYTIMAILFVIIFAASLRRPNFYSTRTRGDYILIGQLYYLNFFAMYMSIVWTIDSLLELMNWNIDLWTLRLLGKA